MASIAVGLISLLFTSDKNATVSPGLPVRFFFPNHVRKCALANLSRGLCVWRFGMGADASAKLRPSSHTRITLDVGGRFPQCIDHTPNCLCEY